MKTLFSRIFLNIRRLKLFSIVIALVFAVLAGLLSSVTAIKNGCDKAIKDIRRNTSVTVTLESKPSSGTAVDYNIYYRMIEPLINSEYVRTWNYSMVQFAPIEDYIYYYVGDTPKEIVLVGVRDFIQLEAVKTGECNVVKGRSFTEDELVYGAYSVIVPEEYLLTEGKDIGDILMYDNLRRVQYKIIGAYSSDKYISDVYGQFFVPLGSVENNLYNLYGYSRYEFIFEDEEILSFALSDISFILRDPSKAREFIEFALDSGINGQLYTLRADDLNYKVITSSLSSMSSIMENILRAGMIFGGLIAVFAVIISFRSRKKEAGLLRSVGVTAAETAMQMIFECLILSALGTLIGLCVGFTVAVVAVDTVTPTLYVANWVTILLFTTILSFIPATINMLTYVCKDPVILLGDEI